MNNGDLTILMVRGIDKCGSIQSTSERKIALSRATNVIGFAWFSGSKLRIVFSTFRNSIKMNIPELSYIDSIESF